MSILNFTVEETTLIAIYKTDSQDKAATLARIAAALPLMDEEIRIIAESASRKLDALTEPDFSACSFLPLDDTDEV